MPIETRSNSALFRRAEQLKRWEESETNNVPPSIPKDKKSKIKFSDGCVFLAACAASDTEEVERLLKQGTDINTANVDGLTALHQACIDNNLEMVQFLVEHGCEVNSGDNEGWTPLHATASCGFLSIAKYLIEHGANVAAVNNDGDLPIDISESYEMEEYLSDVLDEQGIDCDEARSEEERIMLADAKLLVASPGEVNDKVHPRTGATPLHVAASKGYCEVMKYLIQAGADLNAQDNDGWTPLHAASHWCQRQACALLADNLANMDIQNFAGQTCFDVADPEIVSLLEEMKKKQASMQKDRPEIQAILQRTSNRPPLKRRTSVTRMSCQEKSKSVMKDTKAERAHIEKLTLPEEENEEEKEKKQECIELIKTPSDSSKILLSKTQLDNDTKQLLGKREAEVERVPSWKKVLRSASDENVKFDPNVSEVILKRPKKLNESKKDEDAVNNEGQPSIPPVRDEESELQRKAHAKRVRETRRSTQGVLLEDIKSAELLHLINTQQEAAVRQSQEIQTAVLGVESKKLEPSTLQASPANKSSKSSSINNSKEINSHSSKVEKSAKEQSQADGGKASPDTNNENTPSVTIVLKQKSSSSLEDISPTDSRPSLGTQAAIQRRRRPKRRSTGVVYLDSDDAPEEKENINDQDNHSALDPIQTDRHRHRYGSSTSITDSEPSEPYPSPHYGSRTTLSDDDDIHKDYKKLYEEVRKENERLKDTLRKTEEELEKTKKQIQKQGQALKSSVSEIDKKERRSLERKISEMEEEIKQIEKLKADNERLKEENSALIRVISKISQ